MTERNSATLLARRFDAQHWSYQRLAVAVLSQAVADLRTARRAAALRFFKRDLWEDPEQPWAHWLDLRRATIIAAVDRGARRAHRPYESRSLVKALRKREADAEAEED